MTLTIFIARMALAFVLGAAIGLERQWRQRSAGLRTNTLVSVGAAAFILLSLSLTDNAGDPSRVAGQIVTGIGFLGAGVIMKTGMNVQGLNTAATIWCSAAVGTLAGAGLYWQSALTALFIIGSHLLLRPVGLWLSSLPFQQDENEIRTYALRIRCRDTAENHIRVILLSAIKSNEHMQLRSMRSTENGQSAYSYLDAEITSSGNQEAAIEALAAKLTIEYGVTEVSWQQNNLDQDS